MGEMVSYAVSGGMAGAGTGEGYLAAPASGSGPAVVVIQEWWGLVPHIKEVVERFAHHGFVALAPDLDHGRHTGEPDAHRTLTDDELDRAAQDVAGAAAFLAARDGASGRIGAVGFCAGGSLALWSAALSPQVTAVVGFYPRLPWGQAGPRWNSYAGKSALLHCAEADGASEAPGVQAARRAIEAAGGRVLVHDYPGTAPAFFNDDRPDAYDGSAAATAWARTLEFLRAELG